MSVHRAQSDFHRTPNICPCSCTEQQGAFRYYSTTPIQGCKANSMPCAHAAALLRLNPELKALDSSPAGMCRRCWRWSGGGRAPGGTRRCSRCAAGRWRRGFLLPLPPAPAQAPMPPLTGSSRRTGSCWRACRCDLFWFFILFSHTGVLLWSSRAAMRHECLCPAAVTVAGNPGRDTRWHAGCENGALSIPDGACRCTNGNRKCCPHAML